MSADEQLEQLDPRQRLYRNDATLWVWIFYGLAQATITMLMAFDVIETLTAAEVCTAVTLIIYVAVNELLVRPGRDRRKSRSTSLDESAAASTASRALDDDEAVTGLVVGDAAASVACRPDRDPSPA